MKLTGAGMNDKKQNDASSALVGRGVIRSWEDVDCQHAFECFNGCRYGKICYEDDFNNAMGGKPWQECYCMTDEERMTINGVALSERGSYGRTEAVD